MHRLIRLSRHAASVTTACAVLSASAGYAHQHPQVETSACSGHTQTVTPIVNHIHSHASATNHASIAFAPHNRVANASAQISKEKGLEDLHLTGDIRSDFPAFVYKLQDNICAALAAVDGGSFRELTWERKEGGGGRSRVLQDGKV